MMEISKTNEDLIFEEVAVSGVLYITVDKDFICAQKFSEHVKIQITFDKSINVKEQKPYDETSEVQQSFQDEDLVINKEDVCDEKGSHMVNDTQLKCVNDKPSKGGTKRPTTSLSIHKKRISQKQQAIKSKNDFESCSSSSKSITNTCSTSKRKLRKNACLTKRPTLRRKQNAGTSKSCDMKDKETTIMKGGKRYSRIREKEKDVYCPYCEQMFKSQQQFFDHRKSERQNYNCDICHKNVQFKAHLMVHMLKHNQKIESDIRSQGNANPADNVQSKQQKVKCEICGMIASSLEILKTHTMTHTGEYAYKCCVCGQLMNSNSMYKKHMASHSKAGQVQCKICNASFPNRGELCKHKFTHKHKCSLCGQWFPNRTGRYFHYKTFHKNDILKCPECGKLFCNKSELDCHVRYHQNRNRTQCPVCGILVFKLSNHMLSHTSKLEDVHMFVCDKCPKQFKRRTALQRHLRIHSEEKLYACTECSKQFSSCGGLRRHMMIHMPEKPYVCEICGKSCSQLGNLRIHMQTHRESDILHCSHCETRFTNKSALQEHMNVAHLLEGNIFKQSDQFLQADPLYPIYQ